MKLEVAFAESSDAESALFVFINIHFVDKEVFVYFVSTGYLPVNSFEIINAYRPFKFVHQTLEKDCKTLMTSEKAQIEAQAEDSQAHSMGKWQPLEEKILPLLRSAIAIWQYLALTGRSSHF